MSDRAVFCERLREAVDELEASSHRFVEAVTSRDMGASDRASIRGRQAIASVCNLRNALDRGWLARDKGDLEVGHWLPDASDAEWDDCFRDRHNAGLVPQSERRPLPLPLRELINKELHKQDGGYRVVGPDHYLVLGGSRGRHRWLAEYRVARLVDTCRGLLPQIEP
jgi:hypothetical protein